MGGLGIKQRQEDLVQSETTGGLTESSLQTTVYTHLELPFNLFLLKFKIKRPKVWINKMYRLVHTVRTEPELSSVSV